MGQVSSPEQTTLEEVALWEAGLEALPASIAVHVVCRGPGEMSGLSVQCQ
jgi:hypothetical protein